MFLWVLYNLFEIIKIPKSIINISRLSQAHLQDVKFFFYVTCTAPSHWHTRHFKDRAIAKHQAKQNKTKSLDRNTLANISMLYTECSKNLPAVSIYCKIWFWNCCLYSNFWGGCRGCSCVSCGFSGLHKLLFCVLRDEAKPHRRMKRRKKITAERLSQHPTELTTKQKKNVPMPPQITHSAEYTDHVTSNPHCISILHIWTP